mgnify:CR=1 FL=1
MGKKCQNGNGINIFERDLEKNMAWEMGLELPLQDHLLAITFRLCQVIWLAKCPRTLLELNSTTAKQVISRRGKDWNATKREKNEKCSFAEANLLPGYIRQVKKKKQNKTKQTNQNDAKLLVSLSEVI